MLLVSQIMGWLLFSFLIQLYWCIIKHLKNTKLYSIDSYSLFQFEESDVISVLKNSIEYSFVFLKCFIKSYCYIPVLIVVICFTGLNEFQ